MKYCLGLNSSLTCCCTTGYLIYTLELPNTFQLSADMTNKTEMRNTIGKTASGPLMIHVSYICH